MNLLNTLSSSEILDYMEINGVPVQRILETYFMPGTSCPNYEIVKLRGEFLLLNQTSNHERETLIAKGKTLEEVRKVAEEIGLKRDWIRDDYLKYV